MFFKKHLFNMNSSKSIGETSCNTCKRQENGDGSIESERPLKKARFAWQVKGRYHMKNELPENRTINTQEVNYTGSSSENESETTSEIAGNTEQNLEILGDYLLKQDFNTLNSITEPESLLPSTSISTEKLSYPRYINSALSETENDNSSFVPDLLNPHHISHSKNYIEDQCIARWQARQMAKCFVDNTINSVLDNWMIAPVSTELMAIDVAEFMNNLPGDNNSIENEGILMAISAHGLQNTSNSSSSSLNYNGQNSSSNKDVYLECPSSPSHSDDENNDQVSSRESSSNEMEVSWIRSENIKQPDNMSFFPDVSSSSYQSFNETENISNSNEYDISFNENDVNNHYDFLDAAVSFAIQCKGLTSLGTDG